MVFIDDGRGSSFSPLSIFSLKFPGKSNLSRKQIKWPSARKTPTYRRIFEISFDMFFVSWLSC